MAYSVRLDQDVLEIFCFEQFPDTILDDVIFGPCQAIDVYFINSCLEITLLVIWNV